MRRLALKVGRPDFRRFSDEIDIDDVIGWLAFWNVEPFGDEWRQAARSSVTVAGALGKLKDEAEDMFMPNFRLGDDAQSDDEMAAVLASVPGFAEQMRRQGVIR